MTCRKYDHFSRDREVTRVVYEMGDGINNPMAEMMNKKNASIPTTDYNFYFGELHGHTNLSDGRPDIDTYFRTARNIAKLDFCAVSDHDHGCPLDVPLWAGGKWEKIQQKVREYHKDGEFVTILAYERDSYPYYNNLVLYYKNDTGELFRSKVDGEISRDELKALLARDDIITVPHTTSFLHSGADFDWIDHEIMTPLVEVYSRWGTSEYMGNPNPVRIQCKGGFWHDALKKGVKMGCISGSDDHTGTPGLYTNDESLLSDNLRYRNPGVACVLSNDLSREGIFEALRAKRCYATMGNRTKIDFQINSHFMGEEFDCVMGDRKALSYKITADTTLKTVEIIKNTQTYMIFDVVGKEFTQEMIYDNEAEFDTDCYYLRVTEADGRMAWTSPIWVNNIK